MWGSEVCTPTLCVCVRETKDKDLVNLNPHLRVCDFCAVQTCWAVSACICDNAPVCLVSGPDARSKGSKRSASWEVCVCVCVLN